MNWIPDIDYACDRTYFDPEHIAKVRQVSARVADLLEADGTVPLENLTVFMGISDLAFADQITKLEEAGFDIRIAPFSPDSVVAWSHISIGQDHKADISYDEDQE